MILMRGSVSKAGLEDEGKAEVAARDGDKVAESLFVGDMEVEDTGVGDRRAEALLGGDNAEGLIGGMRLEESVSVVIVIWGNVDKGAAAEDSFHNSSMASIALISKFIKTWLSLPGKHVTLGQSP